jgi:hypothetical protein
MRKSRTDHAMKTVIIDNKMRLVILIAPCHDVGTRAEIQNMLKTVKIDK